MKNLLYRRASDTVKRIIGEGNKIKGIFKSFNTILVKKKKVTMQKWTKFVHQTKNKEILDSANSARLKNSLNKIVRRTLKDGYSRIIGNGNKVKGAVKSVLMGIKKRPRIAIKKWLKFAEDCEKKVLLDSARSHKLNNCIIRLPRRVLNDCYQRVIGSGNKTIGVLKTLFLALNKLPKRAFCK